MKLVKQELLNGERALFQSDGIKIEDTIFFEGESPLKESRNIDISQSTFKWKYPLWYCNNVVVNDSTLLETARSGIWYTNDITIKNTTIDAPKTFRRCRNVSLENVNMMLAQETFWNCNGMLLNNVTARGDYFGMNSENIEIHGLNLTGNYCFDGGKNIEVHNSKLISKDSFWNCENVTVYDSTIIGEYFGWNSKNITLVNCTIESLQGFCYIENLKMVNCKLVNTTLAFEYSTVDVEINSHIDSVMNPTAGKIKAKSIGELIIDPTKVDPNATEIIVDQVMKTTDKMPASICG